MNTQHASFKKSERTLQKVLTISLIFLSSHSRNFFSIQSSRTWICNRKLRVRVFSLRWALFLDQCHWKISKCYEVSQPQRWKQIIKRNHWSFTSSSELTISRNLESSQLYLRGTISLKKIKETKSENKLCKNFNILDQFKLLFCYPYHFFSFLIERLLENVNTAVCF